MSRPRVVSRAFWRDHWHPGTSSAVLSELDRGWRLSGRADVSFADGPTTFRFQIDCTPAWDIRSAAVTVKADPQSRRCILEANDRHEWRMDGLRNPDLDGCTDFDIAATPATNLLALRRLGLAVGQTCEILTAWLLLPDIEVQAVRQRYTRLSEYTYRFEALNNGFQAEFDVDDALMVTTYRDDYERIPPPRRGHGTRGARR